jgi:hypothetical protein
VADAGTIADLTVYRPDGAALEHFRDADGPTPADEG